MSILNMPMDNKTEMNEDKKLWLRYHAGDRQAFDDLVERNLPLVKITVGRMAINIPSYISRDDLFSAGSMALVMAVQRYDPERKAKFSTYAITRIRGAVIDELRSHDTLGRVTRDRVKRIRVAENDLHNRDADLTPEIIASEAGLSMDEYYDARMGDLATRRISLSQVTDDGEHTLADLIEDRRNKGTGHQIEVDEVLQVVEDELTEKEKMLVVLYYKESLTLKEVGVIMEVSESRVCQIHTAMVERIRKKLEKMGILF